MTFYTRVEEIIKEQSFKGLEVLEEYYGIELRIHRIKKNKYSRVHGADSGRVSDDFTSIIGIVVNDDVVPLSDSHAGSFTNGLLYTTSKEEIESGSVVAIGSEDDRIRRFQVKKKESFGQTRNVFFRYTLSSIGD